MAEAMNTNGVLQVQGRCPVAWSKVAAMFLIASAIQVFFYGGPRLWGHEGPIFTFPHWPYLPAVLFYFFGPALLAAGAAVRLLCAFYRQQGVRLPKRAIVFIVLMAALSSYLGVFVSFNAWGT